MVKDKKYQVLTDHEQLRERHGLYSPLEPLEFKKKKKRQKNPADTLILTNGEEINFSCFKPPSLWQFVTADPGN